MTLPSGPDDRRIGALATELARVRQRGVSRVDRAMHHQRPVETPVLAELLRGAGWPVRDRPRELAAFLDIRLAEYAAVAADEAAFVRSLYFDAAGRAPGPGGAAGLLRTARQGRFISDETFRKLQRQHLLDLAAFLLMQGRRQRAWWRLRRWVAGGRN